MHYYLILALQGFCIYHAIKNHREYYWFFVIIFLPVIGSIIYIITQVINKGNVNKLNDSLSTTLNPTRKVRDLERKLEFADTYKNRLELADAFFQLRNYEMAVYHYEKILEDHGENDSYVLDNLISALYQNHSYDDVVSYGQKRSQLSSFHGSKTQFLYGLSLGELGRIDEAEENMKPIDVRYSNYEERLILAKFLMSHDKVGDAKEIIEEIFQESKYMNKNNRRIYKVTIAEVEKIREELHVSA